MKILSIVTSLAAITLAALGTLPTSAAGSEAVEPPIKDFPTIKYDTASQTATSADEGVTIVADKALFSGGASNESSFQFSVDPGRYRMGDGGIVTYDAASVWNCVGKQDDPHYI